MSLFGKPKREDWIRDFNDAQAEKKQKGEHVEQDLKHSLECVLEYVHKCRKTSDYPFFYSDRDLRTIISFLEIKLGKFNINGKENSCVE